MFAFSFNYLSRFKKDASTTFVPLLHSVRCSVGLTERLRLSGSWPPEANTEFCCRIRRWKRTEQKKRALCNRRLAKIPGTLQIEEPEFEDLGDESDTASDGADSNEIDKEDSDHGRSDSERQ